MSNSEGVVIQSVYRAAQILNCFSGDNRELGISEIADEMQLSKSTIYGLVNTLVVCGYLEQNNENKRYHLGIKLFELGNLVKNRLNLRNETKPYCEFLANRYGFTAHVAAFYDGNVIYIDKVDRTDSIISFSQVGKRAPMYCTGVGKSILAYLPESFVDENIINTKLVKYTSNTITDRKSLMKELADIRLKGYSLDREEIEFGFNCVAAPIFNSKSEPIAAISVSGPAGRMPDDKIESIAKDVKDCAFKISERLGFKINE